MSDSTLLEELFAEWRRTGAEPAELCADCPHLLDKLVERIQAGDTTPEDQQAAPSVSSGTPVNAEEPATLAHTSAGDSPGSVEPRYQLKRRLGRGSFGEVWLAYDQTLRRNVALKMPRRDRFCDDNQRNLFLAEARKIASLDHANIVRIFDAVAIPARCYLVCDYIDGGNLEERIAKERLSFRESARLVATIAEALHHAHRENVVHRDVKPGNILLGKGGKPFLTDFGLAVSEDELLRERPMIRGTFAYMPPEQARGDSNLVDARSDVYSLGMVLYRLLTGRLPFVGSTNAEYMEQILNRPVRPPRTIDDQIPPPLEEICLRCLHKQREDRYQTALDLSQALTRWLHPGPSRLLRWAAAAVVVLLLLGATLTAMLWPRPSGKPDVNSDVARERKSPGHWDEDKVDIKPNVWYSMLDWEPEKLSFPGEPARLDWEPGKPLGIHCTDCGLISLGRARRQGYTIRVKLRQEDWHGFIGIFLGYHLDEDKKWSFCRYQLFELRRTLVNEQPKLLLEHCLVKENDFKKLGKPVGDHLASAFRNIPPVRNCEFSCVVDDQGVHSVFWNGERLNSLGGERVNTRLRKDFPKVFQGEFGIQTRTGTTTISEFEVKFTDSYCQERKNR